MSVSTKDPSFSGAVDERLPAPTADAEVTRILEALAGAATGLVRCRTEHEVFETAVDAVFKQGFYTALMRLDGTRLRIAAMRQDEGLLSRGTELYGLPAADVVFDATRVPYLDHMWRTRRAVYNADAFQVMEKVHAPEVVKMMRETMPPIGMVDAPVFVENTPWGFVSVQGPNLTAAVAAALELFAQVIGGALENVRHHHRAERRLVELQALQRELVSHARLAAVGEAAGVLSHEARNPLGAILNALAVLRRNAGLDAQGVEVLEIAEEEALKLDGLVRDLMDLARPLEPRLRAVPLPPLVKDSVAALRRRQRALPSIRVEASNEVPEVHADPFLMQLAIENLVRNAAQASGGTSPVEVLLHADENMVRVSVSDDGPVRPTPAGDHDEAFSLARSRGTGLGLAVVKRVVEAQGARLHISPDGRTLSVLVAPAPDAG